MKKELATITALVAVIATAEVIQTANIIVSKIEYRRQVKKNEENLKNLFNTEEE